MPSPVSFSFKLLIKDVGILRSAADRAADLSPVFEQIMDEWAAGNVEKFAKAEGAENTGVEQDRDNFWQPLSSYSDGSSDVMGVYGVKKRGSYQEWKRRRGMPDWLMVATGSLKESLTSPEGFGRVATPTEASFGVPYEQEDMNKILWNWQTRQALFLGDDDRRMIENDIFQYINGIGAPVKPEDFEKEVASE